MYALDPALLELHSHTKQAVVDDLLDDQTLTLFGLHLPARLFRADNSAQREVALTAALRSLNSVLAEPVQDVIMGDGNGDLCLEARTPLDLEADLGLLGGNIFHRSLQWPWAHTEADVGTWGVERRHTSGCWSVEPAHDAGVAPAGYWVTMEPSVCLRCMRCNGVLRCQSGAARIS